MARTPGFFAEGCREIGRKVRRMTLRRRLAAKDGERRQALTRLGQAAWQSKVDLSAWPELRSRLEQLDARAGDLSTTTRKIDAERADLEARRQAAVQRFDALLAPAKAAQSNADAALQAARAALADIDKRQKATTDPAATDAAARAQLAGGVDARRADSERCTAEIARIDGERKAALQPIDADLARLQQASAAATDDRARVGRDQEERFRELGAALYERRSGDPALAAVLQAVAAVDADRATTQAAIDESLGLTSAMTRGTLAKFATVVLLVPAVLVAAGVGVLAWRGSSGEVATAGAPALSAADAKASASRVAADEQRKDDSVAAFAKARTDPVRREEGVEILKADLMMLGSSADRSSLPLLLGILERGEPELRAAAAHAVGMIGPTAPEKAALVKALNDPVPVVRDGALQALRQLKDPRTRLLVQRVGAASRDRSRSSGDGLTPTVAPDAARLGTPLYPGATFLAFASDLDVGRVSFSSADPVQKVVDHYAAAAADRPPVSGAEFTRLYFGGSADDPTGISAMTVQLQTWLQHAMAAQMPEAEMQPEYNRRMARMASLPLVQYADPSLYGSPVFIALEVVASEGATRVARYVVVFQDHALGRTGLDYHVEAEAARK